MSDRYADSMSGAVSRSGQLDLVLTTLLRQTPELQAAAVVSFDGLPMASMLPPGMDEARVAAMSAALLSLGERAAEGLGRGALSQVYVEGEQGTVFLVSADDEAVLVAVGAQGAKVGLLLFEVRRAAASVADTLRQVPDYPEPVEPADANQSTAYLEQPRPADERSVTAAAGPDRGYELASPAIASVPAPARHRNEPSVTVASTPGVDTRVEDERRDWEQNGTRSVQPTTWQ